MKCNVLLSAGLALVLAAPVSTALAGQVTLIGSQGTWECGRDGSLEVDSNGNVTIHVDSSCNLGADGGNNGGGNENPPAPALTKSSSSLSMQEGQTRTFTLKLNSAPASNVKVQVSSGSAGVASVNPASLTFTSANYSQAQTVTVSGLAVGSSTITAATTNDSDPAFSDLSTTVTVNVSAASGGGGPTNNDPGLGKKWFTTYEGQNVFVVDRSAYGNRTYFTGCLSQSWSALGLSHSRSLNPFVGTVQTGCRGYGSIRAGDTYAQRVPFKTGSGAFSIKIARAEAGEVAGQAYDIAISAIPGNLDPTEFADNKRCMQKNVTEGTISLMERSEWENLNPRNRGAYCPIEKNTKYYFNFRPSPGTQGATKCGTSSYVCRVQVVDDIPPSYYQDVRTPSDSY